MNECPPPVLVTLSDMPALFGVRQQTAWRWNTAAARPGSRLPAPDGQLGATPYWFEATIREWAGTRRNKLQIDERVIEGLRHSV